MSCCSVSSVLHRFLLFHWTLLIDGVFFDIDHKLGFFYCAIF